MAVVPTGATFSFTSDKGFFNGGVTRLSVETPSAELIDMTAFDDGAGYNVIVPTGAWKGGSVTVDYLASAGLVDIQLLVRGVGDLTFFSVGFSVTRHVVLESASSQVAVGEAVSGTMKFVMTDYYV